MKKTIDVTNKPCPQPVIETKKALQLEGIKELEIITNSQVSKENITRFLETSGYKFKITEREDIYIINVDIIGNEQINEEEPIACNSSQSKFFIISRRYFGDGDNELGNILMKSFFHTLNESEHLPKTLFFVNSGVYLTTEGSSIVDDLKILASKGVEILSCGTCLDYYNLKEKLLVGRIGNMFRLVELLNLGGIIL